MTELVTNGDFSEGRKGFRSDYTRVHGAAGSDGDVTPSYEIGTNPARTANAYSDWATFGDHTSGDGNMMICNGDAGSDAWGESITLRAGRTYTFDLWARDVDSDNSSSPQLQFFAGGQAIGTALALTGTAATGWEELSFTYTAAATTKTVSIQDLTSGFSWNDYAIDDISIAKGGHAAGDLQARASMAHINAHPAFADDMHLLAHQVIA